MPELDPLSAVRLKIAPGTARAKQRAKALSAPRAEPEQPRMPPAALFERIESGQPLRVEADAATHEKAVMQGLVSAELHHAVVKRPLLARRKNAL